MQVKIKRILSSALCVLMLGSVCYADSVNVTYDPLTELINVNGSFDDTSISEAYVLEVRSLFGQFRGLYCRGIRRERKV
ncbi:MAG: hypothetical protein L6V93_22685 [Clostridiales bacterium]|nr:MAG: hypothetical protein L6V93_22685 [Clostridiales bacterium]